VEIKQEAVMAKKAKKAKKPAGLKYPKKRAAPARASLKARASTKKGPRSQVLPGMEQVRSRKLDNLCEGINDCRTQKNAATLEEKSLDDSALQVMVREGITVYRHGGVELARIPGAEKLRVRLTKETGDAGSEDLEQSDAAAAGGEDAAAPGDGE
jgi:hypothetical protein